MEIEGFRVLRGNTSVEDKNVETQKEKKRDICKGLLASKGQVNFRRRGK